MILRVTGYGLWLRVMSYGLRVFGEWSMVNGQSSMVNGELLILTSDF
jgi:hypothetical protein